MSKKPSQERRGDPRLEKNVPIKICLDNGDVVTQTGNISRSGVYCRVTRPIDPMTKLKVHLLIPEKTSKSATKKISCKGVVVRVEEIFGEDAYNIAIFFNDISARDAERIADYISNLLEETKTT